MDFWRRAAGKSRLEKIRNEGIQEIINVRHTIVEDIHVAQLKWYGHLQRMGEERLPKQILNWTPQGRRQRERELEEDLWMNRDQWRLEIGRRQRTF